MVACDRLWQLVLADLSVPEICQSFAAHCAGNMCQKSMPQVCAITCARKLIFIRKMYLLQKVVANLWPICSKLATCTTVFQRLYILVRAMTKTTSWTVMIYMYNKFDWCKQFHKTCKCISIDLEKRKTLWHLINYTVHRINLLISGKKCRHYNGYIYNWGNKYIFVCWGRSNLHKMSNSYTVITIIVKICLLL